MCIEVVIERGVLETEGVGGYFVCLYLCPVLERDFQYQTTLTLTRHLGPGALFTRARDVQTGLPGESEWRGSRLAQQRERCALHGGT